MHTTVDCPFEFSMELRTGPDTTAAAVHHEKINGDLPALVEETFVRGVLADALPERPDELAARVAPEFSGEPLVKEISVTLVATTGGERFEYALSYDAGRWVRRSVGLLQELRSEGTLGEDQTAYPLLFAARNGSSPEFSVPPLEPPTIVEGTLDDVGCRRLGEGSLVPDRPVLVNDRMVEEIIQWTMDAGPNEIGGATLGKTVRLPEPLPGTSTRVVTVLTTSVLDERHVGVPAQLAFSPEALAEADPMAEMRGMGEWVHTAFHAHGWGTSCGNCNQNAGCVLPEATLVSVQDYQVLESLFPSKATLMPISGRKLGTEGQRPVLQIHGWRGGRMRPLRWQRYHD